MIKIKCQICKKNFYIHLYRINTAKFCSYKCLGKSNKGKSLSPKTQFKKGIKPWNFGKSHSLESKLKMSNARKGRFSGNKHPNWKGGLYRNSRGYMLLYNPIHPSANNDGYVLEHRLVMEKHIGRYLNKEEVVHHINEIKDDNRIENLRLFNNSSEHHKYHYPKGTPFGKNKSNNVKL